MAAPTTVLLEIWRLTRRVGGLLEDALADAPLSPGDFGLYSELLRAGELTPSELSDRTGMPATTTSQVLRRVEDRGHLTRRRNPADARSRLVALNEAGRAAHRACGPAFRAAIDRVRRELGTEHDQVLYSLLRLDEAVRRAAGEEEAVTASPRPDDASTHEITYAGPPLSATEEAEVRAFVDWLRHRRGDPGTVSA